MHVVMNLTEKIETLKSLESYGYSIAYYLLMDEQLAIEATKAALLEVSRTSLFFAAHSHVQQLELKKVIMREALHVKYKELTG